MGITSFMKPGGNLPLFYHPGHMGADSVGQGTWVTTQFVGFYKYNADFNNLASNADGDNYTHNIWLPAGTYTMRLDYGRATNRSIVKLYVDDNYISSQDCYGVSDLNTFASFTGITIGNGKHAIKLLTDGHNASSTGYLNRFYGISWKPTSYVIGTATNPEEQECVSPILIIPSINCAATALVGTWYRNTSTNSNFLYGIQPWLSSTVADGDSWSVNFIAAAGTYTAIQYHQVQNNAGIIDWYIDDVYKFSLDMYAAATARIFTTQTNITITNPNRIHTLRAVCNGKNASSSAYVIHGFSSMLLKRTA